MSLNEAIDEFFMRFRRNHFLVAHLDNIVGVIHMEKVQKIPFFERERLTVGDVMERLEKVPYVKSNENGHEAFMKLSNLKNKADLLLVMDEEEGDIIGFIEPEDFRKTLAFSQTNVQR
jgi:Mg2+/Co2+ transporter CorB